MFFVVQVPVLEMKEGPLDKEKVVSQALFSESVQVQKTAGRWSFITTPDGYLGWVKRKDICARKEPYEGDLEVARLQAHLYSRPEIEFGPLLTLPFGAKLKRIDEMDARWLKVLLPNEKKAYIQRGDIEPESLDLISFSQKFLGIPYTWGGRSSFGFDCSGFSQMVYQRFFCPIPRDAKDQCQDPRGGFVSIDELIQGDLIFWGLCEKQIKHVGIYLENGRFIHASSRENKPYLRISKLQDFEWSGKGFYGFRTARRFKNS